MSMTKPCPFCFEDIDSSAIKCKFCGEFVKSMSEKNSTNVNYKTTTFSNDNLDVENRNTILREKRKILKEKIRKIFRI
jgi:hypothetical protein